MRFIRAIIDGVWDFFALIFGWADTIPGFLRGVSGWIKDRIRDVINGILGPVNFLLDIEWWTGLIHEGVSYILEWADIRDELARVFEIPEWTWNNVILRIADGFLYIIAFAESKREALFTALRPAIENAWGFLKWGADEWRFLIIGILNEFVDTTSWFWDKFEKHVWGRLTAPWGPLETWLTEQADNIRDNILNLGEWIWGWLEEIEHLPPLFMDKVFWQVLVYIKRAGGNFLMLLLEMTEEALTVVAWPITKLGEKILDFVWDSEEP